MPKQDKAKPEKTTKVATANSKKTDKSWQFKKGQSGNPSGRPKVPEDIRQAFRDLTPTAIKTLKEIIENPHAKDGDRIKAADVILDRGYGKPLQSVDIDATNIPQVIIKGEADILD